MKTAAHLVLNSLIITLLQGKLTIDSDLSFDFAILKCGPMNNYEWPYAGSAAMYELPYVVLKVAEFIAIFYEVSHCQANNFVI
jgi:hypothetical protein